MPIIPFDLFYVKYAVQQVTFRPPGPTPTADDDKDDVCAEETERSPQDHSVGVGLDPALRRRVYVAKFNVHAGRTILRRFYVLGFDKSDIASWDDLN